MGLSKTEKFTSEQNQLASIAKALGHPARIAILEVLVRRQSCICGEIVEELPLSQSTVSQHLKELKAAGLIKGEIDGPKVCYCIDPVKWKTASSLLSAMFDKFDNNCC
ncbi:MAG: metalloregulator ArsR/SmtB family transcription factor [Bacteroidia bacterium]|nr:metalloregulator ArsR/SmtB family transcription factor [Bacteroidia bacterium]